MRYIYEDLSDDQFEVLVIFLCQKLLGISVKGFSTGADGGRDAKFMGTAEIFPSKASPWKGITVIQAKHTNGYNKSFSESDFYTATSSSNILAKELPKIIKLREGKELDNYMLFANRKLSALSDKEISSYISKNCSLPEESLYLCGLEQLEHWLKTFPDVAKLANLDPVDSPLIVSPDDLSEVVHALARHMEDLSDILDDPPTPRVLYEEKNKINNMTVEYAKALRKRYLKDTSQIREFLSAPENIDLLRMYESVVDEFQLKIISERKNYQTFDQIIEYLIDLLFSRDPILRRYKRLTRTMVFYMYWNCDIGETE